jgi:hypothetical protein
MSEPAICGRLQSSAAVLANKGRILLTFSETERTELVNAWFQSRARTDGTPGRRRSTLQSISDNVVYLILWAPHRCHEGERRSKSDG